MKVFLDDQEDPIEVSADQVQLDDDDPYLSKDDTNKIVQSRLARERKKMRDELKNDDEFVEQILSKKESKSEIDKLKSENEHLQSQINQTRMQSLESSLKAAASKHNVKDDAQDVLIDYAKSKFKYDDQYGWAKSNGDDIQFDAGNPVSPYDYVQKLKDEKPSFFDTSQPANAGPGNTVESTSTTNGSVGMTMDEWKTKMSNAKNLSDDEYSELLDVYEQGKIIE